MDVFPIAYFGPIHYYQLFVNSENAVIEVKEHFVKQTIRTRCEILAPNGIQTLSIPLHKPNGNKSTIDELEIIDDGWRKVHWKAIETAYSSAAYFDYYGIEIKELIFNNYNRLLDLTIAIHERVLSWLDVERPTILSNSYLPCSEITDYRTTKFDTTSESMHVCYHQVFRDKTDCVQNLSILDLILNEGPMAHNWVFC
ncbi:MAG: WbqC family protein [Crocinitomicaceae bacterium]|nr:WbqC family protein [Crocinitomicaceae bacterium]